MERRHLLSFAVPAAAGILLASCSGGAIEATGIVLNEETAELKIGDSLVLEAAPEPEEAVCDSIEWSSSDESVARVSAEGTVYALKVGAATITARAGELSAECAVSVMPGISSVLVKAGTFYMGTFGGGDWGDESLHEVTLTSDFYMMEYEITNAQFAEFLNKAGVKEDGIYNTEEFGEQPLVLQNNIGVMYREGEWVPATGKDNFPAVCVTWYGANEFALQAGGQLPSEAQWEYACRAGSDKKYCFGDDDSKLGEYAWYSANANTTHEVGTKTPNAWGLYDMHGNAYEWVLDSWDGSDYPEGAATDPVSPTPGSKRIIRGGSWFNGVKECTCTMRNYYNPPSSSANTNGFRIIYMM